MKRKIIIGLIALILLILIFIRVEEKRWQASFLQLDRTQYKPNKEQTNCLLTCSKIIPKEDAREISKLELEGGCYYGLINQKKKGTPNNWIHMYGETKNSKWCSPTKSNLERCDCDTLKGAEENPIKDSKESINFSVFKDTKTNYVSAIPVNVSTPLTKETVCEVAKNACKSDCVNVKTTNEIREVDNSLNRDNASSYSGSLGIYDWVVTLKPICGATVAYINEKERSVICFCAYE